MRAADDADSYKALQPAIVAEAGEPAQAGAAGEQLDDPWAGK